MSFAKKKQLNSTADCRTCQERGHWSWQCSKPKNRVQPSSPQQPSRNPQGVDVLMDLTNQPAAANQQLVGDLLSWANGPYALTERQQGDVCWRQMLHLKSMAQREAGPDRPAESSGGFEASHASMPSIPESFSGPAMGVQQPWEDHYPPQKRLKTGGPSLADPTWPGFQIPLPSANAQLGKLGKQPAATF
ncbi:hypothetical protein WJX84_010843 [Apatococcus fuscideae]|uniref:Uncharacterized protein n=1 Tax=Apatococcus fuscideae TaxID=2026836 RepID=A0AAW1T332_9CHLO